MSVSQMATSRLYKLVQILCSARNANLPQSKENVFMSQLKTALNFTMRISC